jgi:hypothetical protein
MTKAIEEALTTTLTALRIGKNRLVRTFVKSKNVHGAYFVAILATDAIIQVITLHTHVLLL